MSQLKKILQENHFHFSDNIYQQFSTYLGLLQKWNRVFNLTAINDPEDQILLHIVDSLMITPFLHGNRLIDVGTGAGFPGIPLALTLPEKHFVLLDSNSKKTRFLTQVLSELKIQNVEIVHARTEDFHSVECFDSIVTRAFSSLAVMVEKTQHLLAENGCFIAMKGLYPEKELPAIPKGFQLIAVHPLEIKGLAASRCVVLIGRERR